MYFTEVSVIIRVEEDGERGGEDFCMYKCWPQQSPSEQI